MNKKFYKYYKTVSVLLIVSLLFGCAKKVTDGYTMINGVQVKTNLINSGYYFDVASLSETQLADLVDRINPMQKPENIGEVIFNSPIEDIIINTTTPSEVTNQEIEASIEKARDRSQIQRIVEENRPCKIGDTVVVDIESEMEGDNENKGKDENKELHLGAGEIIEELENAIIGKKAGVKFDIEYIVPKNFEDESLRGKKTTNHCLIKYIKEVITPEFDDEFALINSKRGATTSEVYKQELMEDIDIRHKNTILENEKNNLLEQLYNISLGTPSEDGMAWAFNKTIVEQKRIAALTDKTNVEVLTNNQYTLHESLVYYKMQSLYSLSELVLLDALQKKYNITYTSEDRMKWFDKLCIINDYGKDVTYELYSHSMGEAYVDDNARKDKILTEVLKHVKRKYVSLEETE